VIVEEHLTLLDGRTGDGLVDALQNMVGVLREVTRRTEGMIAQAELVIDLREADNAWDDVLLRDGARRLTAMLADSADILGRANSDVRRAQAVVLYANGLSMERIGKLLGISRQRVAILLRSAQDDGNDEE
jgi:Homeodomain-like domain